MNQVRLEGGFRLKDDVKKSISEQPLVSVITVVFNGEATLEKTIKSVLNQTYNTIEYIIIDGGSTDGSLDIIKKYQDKIDYWVSEPDKGIADAFNKGIKKSNGEWIGILNADDTYEEYAIEKVAQQRSYADIIYGKMKFRTESGKEYVVECNHQKLKSRMTLGHPAVFVKKIIYEKYGNFELRWNYAMDYEIMLRFYLKNVVFLYVKEILAGMNRGGVSDKKWFAALKETHLIRKELGLSTFWSVISVIKSTLRTAGAKFLLTFGLSKVVGAGIFLLNKIRSSG